MSLILMFRTDFDNALDSYGVNYDSDKVPEFNVGSCRVERCKKKFGQLATFLNLSFVKMEEVTNCNDHSLSDFLTVYR